MPLSLDIAKTHLLARVRQSAVSVLGVAMGVGFAIAMTSMMVGFQQDFVQRVIDNSPHIVMKDEYRVPPRQPVYLVYGDRSAINLRSQKPRDEVRGIKRAKSILKSLERWPGIDAAPTLETQVFLRYGSKDVSATLTGIDPERERRVTKIEEDITQGSLTALRTASNGIILGNGLRRKLGVALGDTVTAVSPEGVILRMKIVGIAKTGIVAIDDTIAYTLLKKAQILANRTNVINQIRMRADRVQEARAIAAQIERRYRYKTESWQEANEGIMGIFVIQDAIRYAVVGAILIVACFGIFNIISTVIFEKARDIAILKSIGFSEGDIQGIFLLEGVIVGVAGSLVGCALGYGLTLLMDSISFEVGGVVETQGFVLQYSIWDYVGSSAIAIAASTLATYIPARRAARVKPVDIIRGAA